MIVVLSYVTAVIVGFAFGFYAAFILAGKLCEKWESEDESAD